MYSPPAGDAIHFNFTAAYTSPSGNAVAFNFVDAPAAPAEPIAVVAETPSGGWRRRNLPPGFRQPGQTLEEIKAERVRMGILPPDPVYIESDTSAEAGTAIGTIPQLPPDTIPAFAGIRGQAPGLGAHLLPEDLAGLEALAARAAELAMDEEIALWLRLDQQRRLHAEWLRDEDDAAVLLLAIATLH